MTMANVSTQTYAPQIFDEIVVDGTIAAGSTLAQIGTGKLQVGFARRIDIGITTDQSITNLTLRFYFAGDQESVDVDLGNVSTGSKLLQYTGAIMPAVEVRASRGSGADATVTMHLVARY